jgi:hypothetical protein
VIIEDKRSLCKSENGLVFELMEECECERIVFILATHTPSNIRGGVAPNPITAMPPTDVSESQ